MNNHVANIKLYVIKIDGIGREDYSGEYKWRVNDLDKNGKLIPKAAESNYKKDNFYFLKEK